MRNVSLNSFADLLAEVDRLTMATQNGKVRTLGNWNLAQIFEHIGKWIEFSIDDFPFRYPWWMRMPGRVMKFLSWKFFYKSALKPGFRNPPSASAVEPTDVELDAAADYLRGQIQRVLDGTKMEQTSPGGWSMRHDQWEWVQLRHAEMHLGFAQVDE